MTTLSGFREEDREAIQKAAKLVSGGWDGTADQVLEHAQRYAKE